MVENELIKQEKEKYEILPESDDIWHFDIESYNKRKNNEIKEFDIER